jgi:hypothetical protein
LSNNNHTETLMLALIVWSQYKLDHKCYTLKSCTCYTNIKPLVSSKYWNEQAFQPVMNRVKAEIKQPDQLLNLTGSKALKIKSEGEPTNFKVIPH